MYFILVLHFIGFLYLFITLIMNKDLNLKMNNRVN